MKNEIEKIGKNFIKKIKSLHNKKFRDKLNLYLIEGKKLIQEAIISNIKFDCILVNEKFIEKTEHIDFIIKNELNNNLLFQCNNNDFQSVSVFENSDGILAIVKKTQTQNNKIRQLADENIIIAIDSINDPGNMGTILRTIEWFGVNSVLIGENSVDIFNPKTVRGAMGSIFRLNIIQNISLQERLEELKDIGYFILGSSANTNSECDIVLKKYKNQKKVIVLGSESHGISQSVNSLCDEFISIKQIGKKVDSLNAGIALGIILYEVTKNK